MYIIGGKIVKKKTLKSRLFLMSVISIFTYYSTSLAFGVTYNQLHLIYISLFSASFYGLIIAIRSLDEKKVAEAIENRLPFKGIYIFLSLTGIVVFAAWLPDIINSLVSGHSLEKIEVYTTQITYVLDMGLIAPTSFICLFRLKKRKGMGYIILELLLTLCCAVGIMVPAQTVFQLKAGISFPIGAIIIKAGMFIVLAFFALYYNIKFLKTVGVFQFKNEKAR